MGRAEGNARAQEVEDVEALDSVLAVIFCAMDRIPQFCRWLMELMSALVRSFDTVIVILTEGE